MATSKDNKPIKKPPFPRPDGDESAPSEQAGQITEEQNARTDAPGGIEPRELPNNARIMAQRRLREDPKATVYTQAAPDGARNVTDVLGYTIGRAQVQEAGVLLNRYKAGKANLERRIVDNEEWYKLRHWECMRDKRNEVQPTSAWLFNAIANKHADAMDNYPSPNVLPREEGDKQQAKMLSSIIPVILDQCDFEQVYSDVWNYKLKAGTGVYGVMWDAGKLNGLGDISITKVDLINLFWEPGITDIQKSRNLFHVQLIGNDELIEAYPQLQGKLGGATMDVAKYNYDDTVDTSDKSLVIDWYYKRRQDGRTVLHYCKFVNDEVLFATENEPEYKDRGWYDHGEYPFVFDPLFPTEGTPTGYSYIDIEKDSQAYIDRGNQAIMQNMAANARPRYFINNSGSVDTEEYADFTRPFVHTDGQLGEDSIMPIKSVPLSGIYLQILNNKIDELKETSGNRDVNTGGASSGITAASAIAALQEAGSKLSRDNIKAAYRAYRRMIVQIIELIRQFYDLPRQFRIVGENGGQEFISFSNAGIVPRKQEGIFGMDMGDRTPLFDVEVSVQKANPYSRMSQNELAIQFYQLQFFNPANADQTLACLDMMDFDRKDSIAQKVAQNGTMYQQIQQMQQQMMMLGAMVDEAHGTNDVTQSLAAQFGMAVPQGSEDAGDVRDKEALGAETPRNETANVTKARQRVADSTEPT